MNLRRVELVVLLGLALSPATAWSLAKDRQQPMNIGADSSDAVLKDDGQAILRGNVAISQGTLKIGSDEATITRVGGNVSRAVLEGKPATIEQVLDSGGTMKARANRIDYDVANEVVVLTGGVVVTQPEGDMRGENIRYELNTGRLQGGGQGRIEMTIQPSKDAAKPAETPPADPAKPVD
jgi:lipopolysaccharide export system protein LptA